MDERRSTNFAFTIHTPYKGEGGVRSTVSDVYILDRLSSGEGQASLAATARHAAALGPNLVDQLASPKLECQRIESRCNTLNMNDDDSYGIRSFSFKIYHFIVVD